MDEAGLVPEDAAEVEAGADEADLVADPVGDEGGVGVVEDDALLAVDPAGLAGDAGDDGAQAEDGDAVAQDHVLGVEDLALPGEDADEASDGGRGGRAGRDDGRAVADAVGHRPGLDAREELVELGRGHRQQRGDVVDHGGGDLVRSASAE